MEPWQIALVSVVVPTVITAGLPFLSARLKASHKARLEDAKIGAGIRDELRKDIETLRARLDAEEEAGRECREDRERIREELRRAQSRITRLEEQVRRDGGDTLGMAGGG